MHCLNLKLTYECTNQCSFCFSSHLVGQEMSIEGLESAVESGYLRGCRELVLSGGEPTLVADVLMRIMELARTLGYKKFIIQTNGSGLSDKSRLCEFLADFTADKRSPNVCISFSVHGHNADIHDSISRTPGAFEKLIDAIKKISSTNCEIYTNTVVTRSNIDYLGQIAEMLLQYKPTVLQFSMMHLSTPSKLTTGLIETALAIRKLKDSVSTDILRTEGIPYCLMYGMEGCVGESFWPEKLDLYTKDNSHKYNFKQLESGMRWKSSLCSQCIMDEMCMGLWKEHAEEFLEANIKPIA